MVQPVESEQYADHITLTAPSESADVSMRSLR